MPKVSVLMPVFNGEKYISQAIASILAQTFRDSELIVVDDGSTDRSAEIVASQSDKRVRYVANSTNLGIEATLNRAIETANGEYLARLDCDDISQPDRLRKQVNLLDARPKVGLCGTWVRTLGLDGEHVWGHPTDHAFLRGRMLFDCPFAHSSVMMRRSHLDSAGIHYDARFPLAEDYDLWERMSKVSEICNIPEVLTRYRIHAGQITAARQERQKHSIWAVQSRLLTQLQIEPSDRERALHLDIGVGWHFAAEPSRLEQTETWLMKLSEANDRFSVFPREGFRQVLAERWHLASSASFRAGEANWRRYGESRLSGWDPQRTRRIAGLFFKSLMRGS